MKSAEPLAIARELILRPGGLDDARIESALSQVMSSSVDSADLYFQQSREESWALEDGIVKEGSASIEQGVGVRAVAGEKTGFAYSDEIVLPALEEASRAARAIAIRGGERAAQSVSPTHGHNLYLPIDPVSSFTSSEKVAWLERVDRETRKMDPRVKQVMASVVAVHEVVLVATSAGHLAADVRPLVRFNVSVIVEQDGRREQGYAGAGGRITLPELVANDKPHCAGTRGGAPGAGEPGRGSRARRAHDRRARSGLARDPAARSHRPRSRRGLQPQGHVGIRGPRRRAGRVRTLHDRRRRNALPPAWIAQHRRRRHADPVHHAHRKRRAQGLSAGHDERAPHGHEAPRATAGANRSRTSRCRA